MLSFLKHKSFIKSSKVTGISCFVNPDGTYTFHYVLISRKKGKIEIDKFGTFDLEDIPVSTDIPVYISVDGKGVLSKKIILDPLKSAVQQVIPNANDDEFLFQHTRGNDGSTFISIARKDFVDDILKVFADRQLRVLGITVGPFRVVNLPEIFDIPEEILMNPYRITYSRSAHELIDFRKEENDGICQIDHVSLPGVCLLPFYQALSYYIQDENELQYPPVAEQYEEFASGKVFAFAGWSMLIILFVILLENMMLYTGYSEERSKLETITAGNQELLTTLNKMKDELAWKEKFLNQTGISGNTRMSWYADQIAVTIPYNIRLDRMEIHPLISKIKKEKEIEIQPDKIMIDGVAASSQLVNGWINDLKKLTWVGDVTVVNYFRKENASKGTFSLEISIDRSDEVMR